MKTKKELQKEINELEEWLDNVSDIQHAILEHLNLDVFRLADGTCVNRSTYYKKFYVRPKTKNARMYVPVVGRTSNRRI